MAVGAQAPAGGLFGGGDGPEFSQGGFRSDAFRTITGPRRRDDDLRAELGLAPIPLPNTTPHSPARSSAHQTSHVRDMWVHEASANAELRRLVEVAGATAGKYVATLNAAVDFARCRSVEELCWAVAHSEQLRGLFQCHHIALFAVQASGSGGLALRASLSEFPTDVTVRVSPGEDTILGALLSVSGPDVIRTGDTGAVTKYVSDTGRDVRITDGGASLLALAVRGGDGGVVGVFDCLRVREGVDVGEFSEEDEVAAVNAVKLLQAVFAR